MATVTYTNGNSQAVIDWLNETGYFGSVELDSVYIKIKDANDNLLAYIGSSQAFYYTKSGAYATIQNWGYPQICVKCSGGLILFFNASGGVPAIQKQLVITHNNNGDILFAIHTGTSGSTSYYYDTASYAVSWNDISAAQRQTDTRIMNQTAFAPIVSTPAVGNSSYAETAFQLYAQQAWGAVGTFQFKDSGNKYYLTGWYAVEDNDEN